jgi:hypothetical protein
MDLDLSNPHTAGAWFIGTESQVSCLNTNEYVFTIPRDWADANVGGMRLACGRYREGQVATGPSVIAYAPWTQGDPPAANTHLSFVPLVLYKNLDSAHGLEGFCNADNWTGAVWLHNDDKASVAIVGTKGLGNCWYGWQDGMRPEICATWPGGCEANGYGGSNRGYYADSFRTVVLLYDPADLAKVAAGQMQSWEPQPYVWWDITPNMIRPETTYEIGTGGVAYDDAHGLIYIAERGGDVATEKDIIHVFKIAPPQHHGDDGQGGQGGQNGQGQGQAAAPSGTVYASPNPFHDATTIHLLDNGAPAVASPLHVSIYDVRGKLVNDLGIVPSTTVQWDALHRPGGIYFVRATGQGRVWTSKLSLVR